MTETTSETGPRTELRIARGVLSNLRQDLFTGFHHDQWYETLARRDKILLRWERTLRDGASVMGADTPAGRRIGETADFFAYLQEELVALLDRWEERKQQLRDQDAV